MKIALLALLASLLLSLALLWPISTHCDLGFNLPAGHYVYHLAAFRGTFSLTIFTTTPEDNYYRALRIPCWLPASLLLLPIALLTLPLLRRRHPNAAFPVEPPHAPGD